MDFPWGHNRRFNSYSEYFKKQFGHRVQKITVDVGFTCPNRDGTLARGGCTYCNNNAFNPSYCHPSKPLEQQIAEGKEFHLKRYRRAKNFLIYFQPYSNTYAPLAQLKKYYETALAQEGVIGLVIGTRPDVVDDQKLDYLRELSRNYYIAVEYGVETVYNETLEKINRAHTFEQSVAAIEATAGRGIHTGAHFIFGLPGETRSMMFQMVHRINDLPLSSVKFHQLQIVKGTRMEKDYLKNPAAYPLFDYEEYLDFIIRFVEHLNPAFIIERFAGEVPPRYLVSPGWGKIRNDQINVRIEKMLEERNTWQGKKFGRKG